MFKFTTSSPTESFFTSQESFGENDSFNDDNVQLSIKTKKKLNEILAANTGKPYEVIAADTERDYYMSDLEAKEYGLIDNVITSR